MGSAARFTRSRRTSTWRASTSRLRGSLSGHRSSRTWGLGSRSSPRSRDRSWRPGWGGLGNPFTGVFIRAPFCEDVGPGVEVLAEVEGKVVAARGENILVTAFHPELTEDTRFHEYFLEEVCGIERS